MNQEQIEPIDYSIELTKIARALVSLGNGDASTNMGAIENLSREVGRVADAIFECAEALRSAA
jgi:hypothetical protein